MNFDKAMMIITPTGQRFYSVAAREFPDTVKPRSKRGWTSPPAMPNILQKFVRKAFEQGRFDHEVAHTFSLPRKTVKALFAQFAVDRKKAKEQTKAERIESSRRYVQWLGTDMVHTAQTHAVYVANVLPAYEVWLQSFAVPGALDVLAVPPKADTPDNFKAWLSELLQEGA